MEFASLRTQRATLADQIEAHIRDLVVSERLGPGEVLPSSTDLAAEFGVSRTIIREAMKSLQAKGLIDIANGKRARVRPMTNSVLVDFFDRFARTRKQAVIDLLELRQGIEVQGATLAARRRSADDLALMWASVNRMGEYLGDVDVFLEMDVQLHVTIARASQNQMLFHLVSSIREVMRDTMREGLMRHPDAEDWKRNHADHCTLVTLIDQQDEQGAGSFMALHFNRAMHRIMTHEPVPQTRNPAAGSPPPALQPIAGEAT